MATAILTRQERQEQTREELLRAAALVFERKGFHGAKLEDVAREAGLTTGAVYSNFKGKDELFLALADHQIAERLQTIRAVADAGREGDAAIDAEVASQFVSFFQNSSSFPLLFHEFWTYGARRPELRERFAAHREELLDAIADAVVGGAEARGLEFLMPPRQVAAVIRATMSGLAFESAMSDGNLAAESAGWAVGSLVRAATRPKEET